MLFILTLMQLFNVADRLIMSILMEDIKADFTLTDTQMGLLAGLAFALFYAFMGVPIARLADRFNRKNIVAVAVTSWSAMTALCGAATGFVSLFFARLGVGVGEAGGGPPAVSILSDYFKRHELARAMGIYTLGATIGTAGGLMIGGYFADLVGWRLTFVVLGVPGILLGAILYFTIREPDRGRYSTKAQREQPAEDFLPSVRTLLHNRVYVRTIIAFALVLIIGYAVAIWMAPIMARNFEISTSEVGFYLGLAFILGGIPGPILSGYVTDYMVRFSPKWRAWVPAIAIIASFPAIYLSLVASTFWAFLGFFSLGYGLFLFTQGPSLSILQSEVGPKERALGVSFALLTSNLCGQALGPFLVGLMSDSLQVEYGKMSLNYAVMILCGIATILSAIAYFWTARAIEGESEHLAAV